MALLQAYPMSIWMKRLIFAHVLYAAVSSRTAEIPSLAAQHGGTNPSSGDWNTAANWTPTTVPNGPSDIAMFGHIKCDGS